VLLINLPADVDLGLPAGVEAHRRAGRSPYDVILLFAMERKVLDKRLDPARSRLAPAGGLWVAWPKRSSGVPTDLDGNIVQSMGLSAGLVDNKVCSINATWSGLRFVIRLRDRTS
jgi:hypothetical protein